MIPRTKVNYGFRQILAALFTRERGGRHLARLKEQVRDYVGGGNVALTASGRAGLMFLFKAAGRPNVVAPAYTCKAVAEAIQFAGCSLHPVATEESGFNMCNDSLEEVLSRLPQGSATVVATHQYGMPCDIRKLLEVARRHDALVIEDAAGSLGTVVAGRNAGGWGDAAVFSFDSTKLLHSPLKAGAVVVRDAELFERLSHLMDAETRPMPWAARVTTLAKATILVALENSFLYRLFHFLTFQRKKRFMFDGPQMQSQPDAYYSMRCANWQARIVAEQMDRLALYVERRREQYAYFSRQLADCRSFELPPADGAREWSCVRFPILVRGDKLEFYRRCVERGVDLAFSFTYLARPEADPRAAEIADRVVNLPFYTKLSDRELKRVAEVLHEIDGIAGAGEDPRCSEYGAEPAAEEGTLLDAGVLERQGGGARRPGRVDVAQPQSESAVPA